jgi:carboxyl-terminal processing protease
MQGFPLTDGSVIMLTIGRVRTPCGRIVQREYRGISRRDYYRLAGAVQDTAGRPSCRTAAGRTVYGGGGIYPDVLLPEPAEVPRWLERLLDEELPMRWAAGFLSEDSRIAAQLDSAPAPAASSPMLASFRQFARAQGAEVPEGEEADVRLGRILLLELAATKSGEAGYFRLRARLDPVLRDITKHFERVTALGQR